MSLNFLVDVYTYSDYADPQPNFAVLWVNEALMEKIKELQDAVKQTEADNIRLYGGSVEFYENPVEGCDAVLSDNVGVGYSGELSKEEDTIRTEWASLVVNADSFWYRDVLKHTNISIETHRVSINSVDRCLEMTLETAAKFVSDEDETVKAYAAKLLAEGEKS
jgi:hypothetical protein